MVWKNTTSVMGIFNVEDEPRQVKISRWSIGARKSTLTGIIIGLLPAIIS